MQQVEQFRWLVPSPSGKARLTSYLLTRAEAGERFSGATPVLSTLVVREVYQSRDEANAARGNIGAGIVAAGGGAKPVG